MGIDTRPSMAQRPLLDDVQAREVEEQLFASLRQQTGRHMPIVLPRRDFWDKVGQLLDTIEMQIREVNKPARLTSSTKSAITAFGEVQLPRAKANGASGLTNAIHEILSSSRVTDDDFKRTKTTRMRSVALPGIAQSGQQIEQVIGDLHFEARQSDVLNVIADLESSPWIDSISSVRLTRIDKRLIRVNLSLEAWVVSQKRGRNSR